MTTIVWQAGWNTGIDEIDAQHRRIIQYMNELGTIADSGKADEIRHVMDGLVDYTITHFDYEEELQARARYPFLKAHRLEHKVFRKKIANFVERANRGENIIPELLGALESWLVHHINQGDRDYVESVQTIMADSHEEHASWMAMALKRLFGEHAHVSGWRT